MSRRSPDDGNDATMDHSAATATGPKIYALEIEDMADDVEEMESLVHETVDGQQTPSQSAGRAGSLRLRSAASTRNNANTARSSSNAPSLLGFVRSGIGSASTLRSVTVLLVLAGCSVGLVAVWNGQEDTESLGVHSQDKVVSSPHAPSLGGAQNSAHYVAPSDDEKEAGHWWSWWGENNDDRPSWLTKAHWFQSNNINDDNSTDTTLLDCDNSTTFQTNPDCTSDLNIATDLAKSNVGAHVISLSTENIVNKIGHYRHDIVNSPWASVLAEANFQNATHQQVWQDLFRQRFDRTAATYGEWTSPLWNDNLLQHLPEATWRAAPLRDVPSSDFGSTAWQADPDYLEAFLTEAKALIARVKEGIYEEYGYGIVRDGTTLTTAQQNAILADRLREFRVIVGDYTVHNGVAYEAKATQTPKRLPGLAYLNQAAWDGLVRKLLHSLVSLDAFYVVMVGRAGPTYASNNLWQSPVMQFHHVMEPVLDKLGVQLVSRNMGMNATVGLASMGGADIFGEADIFWHVTDESGEVDGGDPRDPNMVDSPHMIDLMHKQAILSGERMPVILSPEPVHLLDGTKNQVWMGNLQPGASFCEATKVGKPDNKQGKPELKLPTVPACQYVRCSDEVKHWGTCNRHNSVCWVGRSDKKELNQEQDRFVGETNHNAQRENRHPNPNVQKLKGRKLAMLVLHALDEAIDVWGNQLQMGNMPLSEDVWHVSKVYETLRNTVRASRSSACEHMLRKLNPNMCHMELHALTEWTPRVDPNNHRLKNAVKNLPIADNQASLKEVYDTVDLMPPEWWIPDGETDVHMIAIATDVTSMQEEGDKAKKIAEQDDIFEDDDGYFNADEDDFMDYDYGFDDDGGTRRRDVRAVNNTLDHTKDDEEAQSRPQPLQQERRQTLESEVSPKAWTVYNAPIGFCDGSSQSRCHRTAFNSCLMANHNHYRAGIMGHGQSGKLSLSIPNVKEGIVLARFEWRLEGGPRIQGLRPDFAFDVTINGGETITYDRSKFAESVVDLTPDLRLHQLYMDTEMSHHEGESRTVDVELEVRSPSAGTTPILLLSHIYYA